MVFKARFVLPLIPEASVKQQADGQNSHLAAQPYSIRVPGKGTSVR